MFISHFLSNVGHKKGMMKVGRKIKIHTVPVSPEPEYQVDGPISLVNIFGGKKETTFKSFRFSQLAKEKDILSCKLFCNEFMNYKIKARINGDYIPKRIGFKFGYICIKPVVVGRIIRISVDRIRKCNRETNNVSIETMEFGKMEFVFPTITKAIIFYNVINGIVKGKMYIEED